MDEFLNRDFNPSQLEQEILAPGDRSASGMYDFGRQLAGHVSAL
jgi:hypothetical protein